MIMDNKKVKELVLAALGIALVFLATYLIKVPNGISILEMVLSYYFHPY